MNIKFLTAAGLFAAMVALAGCETEDDTWETEPAPADRWEQQPEPQTQPQPQTRTEPTAPADRAEQTWEYDAEADGMEQRNDQTAMGPGAQPEGQQQDVDMTEFAALDTDASGELTEEQWVPEAVGGVQFDEVDQDGDGVVTREEFREYFMEGEGADRQQDMMQ
ncbi:MAG: hypothetical protein ACNA7W_20055 [Pseudomonadales bacterium]